VAEADNSDVDRAMKAARKALESHVFQGAAMATAFFTPVGRRHARVLLRPFDCEDR
jgi:hypothetical protein